MLRTGAMAFCQRTGGRRGCRSGRAYPHRRGRGYTHRTARHQALKGGGEIELGVTGALEEDFILVGQAQQQVRVSAVRQGLLVEGAHQRLGVGGGFDRHAVARRTAVEYPTRIWANF